VKDGVACLVSKCNKLVCTKAHVHSWKEGCFCEEKIPREMFERFLSQELKSKYQEFCLKSFTDNSKNAGVTKCPNVTCSRWWKKVNDNKGNGCITNTTIVCDCSTKFCGLCGLREHDPLPCKNALDWQKRGSEDTQTRIWRELNTATCPNPQCGVTIERYVTNEDHCLHMICSQCKFHWCWACRKRFKVGGADADHENYYKCRYLQEGSVGEEVKKRERVLRESQMYKFYKERMKDCDEGVQQLQLLTTQLKETIAIEGKEEEFQFLIDGIDELITATLRKKILNPVAFYSAHDGKKKLFEFQLKYMNEHYEKLLAMLTTQPTKQKIDVNKIKLDQQAMLRQAMQTKDQALIQQILNRAREQIAKAKAVMRPLSYYKEREEDIVKATRSVSEFFFKLFQKVRDGDLVTILGSPDPKNNSWFCSNCQRSNTFGESVCECAWTAVKK